MPYIAPYRSQLRPYNHAYAYRGLTAFATLSMAVSGGGGILNVPLIATTNSSRPSGLIPMVKPACIPDALSSSIVIYSLVDRLMIHPGHFNKKSRALSPALLGCFSFL
ncbi:MAG: hypothetical protein ABW170_21425 [Candidatus Thiodiazotropha sp. L084R]